jgi:hypothetical protein
MESFSHQSISCDGCGRPASPGHIAERVARLELATRFRPVHIQVLFVALAPATRLEDDFSESPQSRGFLDSLLDAVGIAVPVLEASTRAGQSNSEAARLAEFQRKGYYLSYLSECPIPENSANLDAEIAAFGPTFLRRVRFNYKPKRIALLGSNLAPMIEILETAGLGPLLLLDRGQPMTLPKPNDLTARAGFQNALSSGATADNPISEL